VLCPATLPVRRERSQAAQRPRAKPLGGSGFAPPILAHLGRQATIAFSAASRVGFSELLGIITTRLREVQQEELLDALNRVGHVLRGVLLKLSVRRSVANVKPRED